MDIQKTAQRLKIHANTVIYRLSKIKDTLGLDPRLFTDAFKIKLALVTLELLNK